MKWLVPGCSRIQLGRALGLLLVGAKGVISMGGSSSMEIPGREKPSCAKENTHLKHPLLNEHKRDFCKETPTSINTTALLRNRIPTGYFRWIPHFLMCFIRQLHWFYKFNFPFCFKVSLLMLSWLIIRLFPFPGS